MFAKDCIDSSVPFIRTSDKVGYALDLMQEFKTDYFAVVQDDVYLGSISEKTLLECDDNLHVESIQEKYIQDKIIENVHVFDVIKMSEELSNCFLAVVSSENEYVGITTPQKIINVLNSYSSMSSAGGVLVLELEAKNYSLTEISKIVESNNAIILHCTVAAASTQNYILVSLKINKNDLKNIQSTFERYQYSVLFVMHQSEFEMQLKDRLDGLMKYLEV